MLGTEHFETRSGLPEKEADDGSGAEVPVLWQSDLGKVE